MVGRRGAMFFTSVLNAYSNIYTYKLCIPLCFQSELIYKCKVQVFCLLNLFVLDHHSAYTAN